MINKDTNFYLIISPKSSAQKNMEIDQSLIENFSLDQTPVLRFYTWEKDSATIGISQNLDQYKHLNKNLAKRMTGGGVLFHGYDLSYSILIPSVYVENMSVKKSYEYLSQFLLEFYKELGLNVSYAKDDKTIELSKNAYCQIGFEAYDIVIDGKKIGGNAQRRSKKAVFQHGSIPIYSINKNNYDEEIGTSLEDLDIMITYEEAIFKLCNSFKKCFGVTLQAQ